MSDALSKLESFARETLYLDDREKADSLVRCVAAIWVLLEGDDAGMIVGTTQSADRIFGYAEGKLVGEKLEVLVPGQFRGDHAKHFDKFAEDPEPRAMGGANARLLGLTRDKTEFPVEIGLHPQLVRRRKVAVALIAPARQFDGRK